MLLHRDTSKHRQIYTQTPLHTDPFTYKHSHTQTYLHIDALTQRPCYTHTRHTQTLSMHTDRKLVYTDSFYTRTLLHTDPFTHRLMHTDAQAFTFKEQTQRDTPTLMHTHTLKVTLMLMSVFTSAQQAKVQAIC